MIGIASAHVHVNVAVAHEWMAERAYSRVLRLKSQGCETGAVE